MRIPNQSAGATRMTSRAPHRLGVVGPQAMLRAAPSLGLGRLGLGGFGLGGFGGGTLGFTCGFAT